MKIVRVHQSVKIWMIS